jgi:hypothetical protein
MVLEEEYLKNILDTVAKGLNISKWSYVINADRNYVNYAGNLISISLIEVKNGNELGILIKRAPNVPRFENMMESVFNREVHVYSTLIPIFNCLNMDFKELHPECYFADSSDENRVLVLKDMTQEGFMRAYQADYLDYDHMKVSLVTLSKFHALSFVLFKKNIEFPNKNILRPILSHDPKDYISMIRSNLSKHLATFETKHYAGFWKKLHDNIDENVNNCVLAAKKQIYGHGDFWKENILFKYIVSTYV